MGKKWKQWQILFSWAPKSLWMVTTPMKLKDLLLGRKAITNLDSVLKSRDITLLTKVHLVKPKVFPVDMYEYESWIKELMFLNCTAGEDSWESLGQPTRSNQLILRKSTLNIHWKDWCWSSNTLTTWCEELTDWKRLWYWKRLRTGGEEGDRGWNGWMASPTQWTCIWTNSRRWWRTRKPGVLQSMGHKESDVT